MATGQDDVAFISSSSRSKEEKRQRLISIHRRLMLTPTVNVHATRSWIIKIIVGTSWDGVILSLLSLAISSGSLFVCVCASSVESSTQKPSAYRVSCSDSINWMTFLDAHAAKLFFATSCRLCLSTAPSSDPIVGLIESPPLNIYVQFVSHKLTQFQYERCLFFFVKVVLSFLS